MTGLLSRTFAVHQSLMIFGLCRYGIRGLVIDPYNELDHQRPLHMTETEYVSQMLTKIKRFAQHNDVHVWFVAHPRQLQGWRGEPPNLYDISGSAHFINKADNGIVIHRNRDPEKGALKHVRPLPFLFFELTSRTGNQHSCFLLQEDVWCLLNTVAMVCR